MIERMPAPPILWSPTPTCGPRPASAPTSTGSGASAASASPATTTSCAGRSTTWTPSGARSGITSRFRPRPHSGPALADETMPGARWFPDAHLNWAEHCLRLAGRLRSDTVLVARSQTRDRTTLTADELRDEVARVRAGLERLGVGRGDRVAATCRTCRRPSSRCWRRRRWERSGRAARPSSASASSSTASARSSRRCSSPSTATGTASASVERGAERWPPSARRFPAWPQRSSSPTSGPDASGVDDAMTWAELAADEGDLRFEPVPFDHPLFVLYSPARPGCRSRSSTATAASCSSTSRSTRCTTISGRRIGSSGSARPAG